MSLNGSGVFTVNSAGQPVVASTLITSAAFNLFTADVATALSTAMYKDGQQTVTANIPFGGFKLTGVGTGTALTDAATLNNILAGTGTYVATVGGTADVITLTPSPAITAYAAGQTFRFIASGANTTNVTVAVSGLVAKAITKNGTTALIAGDITSAKLITIAYDGTQFQLIGNGDKTYLPLLGGTMTGDLLFTDATYDIGKSSATRPRDLFMSRNLTVGGTATFNSTVFLGAGNTFGIPRSALAGCTLSTAGSSTTMSIAAGQAVDSTNVAQMNLTAIAKTTSAWAVGNAQGGLDTGSIATSTWYHFYVIMRVDTGVVDVLFSTSASAPTMPANYTLKRRIGSGKTDGGSNWTAFTQDGDYFRWAVSILDVNVGTPGTTARTDTLTVPTGVNVEAIVNARYNPSAGNNGALYLSDLAATDEAASSSAAPLGCVLGNNGVPGIVGPMRIRTNTSAQIRSRMSFSDGSTDYKIATLGWYDRRGRNA